jgi:hypothetical protein
MSADAVQDDKRGAVFPATLRRRTDTIQIGAGGQGVLRFGAGVTRSSSPTAR